MRSNLLQRIKLADYIHFDKSEYKWTYSILTIAQLASVLTLEEARRKVMMKITEIEEFIQQSMTVGCLHLAPWVETGD